MCIRDRSSIITVGTKVSASNVSPYTNSTDAKGFVEKIGSPIVPITGISTIGFGTGYDDTSSPYSNVNLYSITGDGSGAKATVIVSAAGTITNVSIASTGNGYTVGDVLGITTADVGNAGAGYEVTVTETFGMDTLFLTNVQGEKFNNGRKLVYYSNIAAGTIVSAGGTEIRDDSTINGDLYTGNIVEISNFNHSMKSDLNVVEIANVAPDTIPELLSVDLSTTDTTIGVANTTPFSTFEGISTSTGYVKIGQEIIFLSLIHISEPTRPY